MDATEAIRAQQRKAYELGRSIHTASFDVGKAVDQIEARGVEQALQDHIPRHGLILQCLGTPCA